MESVSLHAIANFEQKRPAGQFKDAGGHRANQALQAFSWVSEATIDEYVREKTSSKRKALQAVRENGIALFRVSVHGDGSATLSAYVHSEFYKLYYLTKLTLQPKKAPIQATCVCKAQYVHQFKPLVANILNQPLTAEQQNYLLS
jgi:hypothetical protein